MKLKVNGEAYELAAASSGGATVAQLVQQMGLSGQPVAVEVNKQLVPKRRHGEATLREGDVIEVVTLVGGG